MLRYVELGGKKRPIAFNFNTFGALQIKYPDLGRRLLNYEESQEEETDEVEKAEKAGLRFFKSLDFNFVIDAVMEGLIEGLYEKQGENKKFKATKRVVGRWISNYEGGFIELISMMYSDFGVMSLKGLVDENGNETKLIEEAEIIEEAEKKS